MPGACWTWTWGKSTGGYGKIFVGGKTTYTHRLVYELKNGPIPEGLEIDHLCRNRACFNPGHMEAVTHRTNLLRSDAFSGRNARKTHCKRGHPLEGENVQVYVAKNGQAARCCKECNRQRTKEWLSQNPDYQKEWQRARRATTGRLLRQRAFCKRGHSLDDPSNIKMRAKGRSCRTCEQLSYLRRKGLSSPVAEQR